MNKLLEHRGIIRENLFPLIGICLCLYFSYHAISGNRSLTRMMGLKSQIETLTLKRDNLIQQREALEQKVVMMRPGSLNKDLLEERARVVLGYKSENDVVILGN